MSELSPISPYRHYLASRPQSNSVKESKQSFSVSFLAHNSQRESEFEPFHLSDYEYESSFVMEKANLDQNRSSKSRCMYAEEKGYRRGLKKQSIAESNMSIRSTDGPQFVSSSPSFSQIFNCYSTNAHGNPDIEKNAFIEIQTSENPTSIEYSTNLPPSKKVQLNNQVIAPHSLFSSTNPQNYCGESETCLLSSSYPLSTLYQDVSINSLLSNPVCQQNNDDQNNPLSTAQRQPSQIHFTLPSSSSSSSYHNSSSSSVPVSSSQYSKDLLLNSVVSEKNLNDTRNEINVKQYNPIFEENSSKSNVETIENVSERNEHDTSLHIPYIDNFQTSNLTYSQQRMAFSNMIPLEQLDETIAPLSKIKSSPYSSLKHSQQLSNNLFQSDLNSTNSCFHYELLEDHKQSCTPSNITAVNKRNSENIFNSGVPNSYQQDNSHITSHEQVLPMQSLHDNIIDYTVLYPMQYAKDVHKPNIESQQEIPASNYLLPPSENVEPTDDVSEPQSTNSESNVHQVLTSMNPPCITDSHSNYQNSQVEAFSFSLSQSTHNDQNGTCSFDSENIHPDKQNISNILKMVKVPEKVIQRIDHSSKFIDDVFEYRFVILPRNHPYLEIDVDEHRTYIMLEAEWRSLGIRQTRGWEHIGYSRYESHVFLFRRPIGTYPRTGQIPIHVQEKVKQRLKDIKMWESIATSQTDDFEQICQTNQPQYLPTFGSTPTLGFFEQHPDIQVNQSIITAHSSHASSQIYQLHMKRYLHVACKHNFLKDSFEQHKMSPYIELSSQGIQKIYQKDSSKKLVDVSNNEHCCLPRYGQSYIEQLTLSDHYPLKREDSQDNINNNIASSAKLESTSSSVSHSLIPNVDVSETGFSLSTKTSDKIINNILQLYAAIYIPFYNS